MSAAFAQRGLQDFYQAHANKWNFSSVHFLVAHIEPLYWHISDPRELQSVIHKATLLP